MQWTATIHLHLDIEAGTEDEAYAIVRQRVEDAGMRFGSPGSGPSHSVNGIRLDVPLAERVRADRLAEQLGVGEDEVDGTADFLEITPIGRTLISSTRLYKRPDAETIARHLGAPS